MTLQELVERTAARFQAAKLHYGHGTDNAFDEAAFLVLRGLGLPFNAPSSKVVTGARLRSIESLTRKRIKKRMPVAYLLNEAWLDGHSFYVDRRVIIPRSHIAFMLGCFGRPRRVLDLCTGSGCLAILAAFAFPGAEICASDVSRQALEVAARNVARYRLRNRIRLIRSDLFAAIKGEYDLIVANPPYVSAAAMRRLPAEYRHEPGMALAGGRDGLLLVNRIVEQARHHLSPRGRLACEIGDGRRPLQRAWPKLKFTWPATALGAGAVFVLRAPY